MGFLFYNLYMLMRTARLNASHIVFLFTKHLLLASLLVVIINLTICSYALPLQNPITPDSLKASGTRTSGHDDFIYNFKIELADSSVKRYTITFIAARSVNERNR